MHEIAVRAASTKSGMLQTERLVLFPFGLPTADDVRERCSEFLLRHKCDLRRIIDAPSGNVERFCSHLRRIQVLRSGVERPIVVLTRSNPIALSVLQTRMRIERELPILHRATWMIVVDRREDPLFETSARQLGKLQLDTPDEGAWTGPLEYVFIVLFAGRQP